MASAAGLTVLGSGSALPRADRGTSCYVLDDGAGTAVLVDLGPGALHRAAQAGWPLERLSGVLVTHLHPDHSADLVALDFALRHPSTRAGQPPLVVWGHPALGLLRTRLRNAWRGWLGAPRERLQLLPLEPGSFDLPGGWKGRCARIQHTETSLGYRIELPGGRVVAFSGDATEGAGLLEIGHAADLFVLEAAGADAAPIPGHLTPRRAGLLAAACAARHLLLTHFYPAVLREPIAERVREAFEGRLTLAQDGLFVSLDD